MTRLIVFLLVAVLLVSGVAAQDTVIDVGETVEGTLDAAETDYTVTAESGQLLLINLRSTEFDPLLVISDGRTELARDDDSGGDRNAQLRFTVPDNGDYTLTVTSYDGSGLGQFSLSIEAVPVQQIEPGQTIEGTLNDSAVFLAELEAETTYVVSLESSEFDAKLTINDPAGSSVATDDDGGIGTNALIRYTALETGQYTITASSYSAVEDASYTLTLNSLAYTALTIGDPLTFDSDAETSFFTFSGSAGDVVEIMAVHEGGEDTEAELTLSDSNGLWLGSHTVFGEIPAHISAVVLPQDDRYVVSYLVNAPVTATISINSVDIPSLDEDVQTIVFNSEQSLALLNASAESGQRYRLTITLVEGSLVDTLSLTITQDDGQVSNVNVGPMEQIMLDFMPEQDGDLLLRLESYVYETLAFEVMLEALDAEE